MKRRKTSSELSEKRPRLSSEDNRTPTRTSTTRSRFVTPFKTPLKTCSPESKCVNSPVLSLDQGSSGSPDVVKKLSSEEDHSLSPSLGHISTPRCKAEVPGSKTSAKRFSTPLKVLQQTPDSHQSPMQLFLKEKKLQKELEEKESLLRKFKQYRRAKDSGEIEKLENLVKDWRTVSQEVLLKLLKHGKNNDPSLTMGTVIQRLKVSPELVQFDEENDEFTE